MNVLNNNSDDVVECPLCMEPLEADDLNFYPCTCGYQICRFCWHRIRTDENELCPACRKAYPENPADFTPLSQEQIAALKAEKRQRDQQRKQKITENRKHLANVRVVQKNLVFVVGLPPRLADADILKKHEYFGKYGKIHKVVINPSTAYAGQQGPSASAYVTYVHNNDALRAIQSVNNIAIDGRLIKTSLGTTKYCSHFMKNQQCPKSDCMYLHELGDPEASFTKDEMHQGKHQEYEKRLHEALIASSNGSVTTNSKSGDNKLGNGTGTVPSKEAWPSLSVSPVNTKEQPTKSNGKGNKEGNRKHDKTRGDKKGQKNQKGRNDSSNNNSSSNHNKAEHNNNITNGVTTTSTNHHHQQNGTTKDTSSQSQTTNDTGTRATTPGSTSTTSSNDKQPTKQQQQQQQQQHHQQHPAANHISADDEVNLIDDLDKDTSSEDNDAKNGDTRSLSSSSSNSCNSGESGSTLSESTSGKSSPGSFPDHPLAATPESQKTTTSSSSSSSSMTDTQGDLSSDSSITQQQQIPNSSADTNSSNTTNSSKSEMSNITSIVTQSSDESTLIDTSACLSKLSLFDDNNSFFSPSFDQFFKEKLDNDNRTVINNQINNAITSQLPDLLSGIDGYQNQNTSSSILNGLSGIGGGLCGLGGLNPSTGANTAVSSNNSFIDSPDKFILSTLNSAEEWEQALKILMMRSTKPMEEQQHQQQEEYLRLQELQKRNLMNTIGMNPPHLHDFNGDFLHNGTDMNRLSQSHLYQQQQQQQQQQQHRQPNNLHADHNSIFGTNMSKFFDFHKNQQQQQMQHQHLLMNGYAMLNDHRDHLSMAALLENRMNSQHMEHTNGLIGQQLQKQRIFNKFDQIGSHNSSNMLMNPNNNPQQQQNRIHNQYPQNAPVDDDLGFDPFFETQKALAEIMENEQSQNNHNKHLLESCQRTRMPPPGFNHMNAFGFGVPRPQGSKILPFMNNAQQQMPQQNNWPHHMGSFPQSQPPQQQQQQGNEQQMHMGQPNQNHNKAGYGNMSDWTAMDPAILSFRQFPSYPSHQQHDMFMHLNPQSGQGFGHHGQQMQNNMMNQQQQQQQQQQQNSAPQVNYSHSNWFNNSNEQSMFMNSLGNGYTRNKQQKTECIN